MKYLLENEVRSIIEADSIPDNNPTPSPQTGLKMVMDINKNETK